MKLYSLFAAIAIVLSSCISSSPKGESAPTEGYKFAFLTDVHLNKNDHGNGSEGLRKALAHAKTKGVDFVLFGGDLVDCDHLGDSEQTADSLYTHLKSIVEESGLKAYYTLGNHDRYYKFEGEVDSLGFKTFEKHLGPTYHHFEHKGSHFFVINAMHPSKDNPNWEAAYNIDDAQKEWIRSELKGISKDAPIFVSTHVPFLSLYYPVVDGNFNPYDMIYNTKEVFEIFHDHNVKLFMQGHQHIFEQIQERGRWFVTAGGVCAMWWDGAFLETEEGYLLVSVEGKDRAEWEYIDYGWEAAPKQ